MHETFQLTKSNTKSDKPKSCRHTEATINGKPISYEQMYNIVGRRFHECLDRSAKESPDLAD